MSAKNGAWCRMEASSTTPIDSTAVAIHGGERLECDTLSIYPFVKYDDDDADENDVDVTM